MAKTHREGGGEAVLREDLPKLVEMRRHVKKLQVGTPLLLRTVLGSGQEELQICTFCVSQDLQTLRWVDQEGTGSTHEAPISAIVDVAEDHSLPGGNQRDEDDSHYALTVTLKKAEARQPVVMGLICASPEDLASWRDGLRYLAKGPSSLPAPVPPSAPSSSAPSATRAGRAASAGNLPAAATAPVPAQKPPQKEAEEDLRRQLQEERQVSAKLREENERLQEALKRKDATIAELVSDLQSRPTGATERCNKTESTSRESDDHLRDRELTLLRRRNHRLQKALRAKQQTVAELLQLVGRVTQQQGMESSAVEDVGEEEDDLSDGGAAGAGAAAAALAAARAAPSAAAASAPPRAGKQVQVVSPGAAATGRAAAGPAGAAPAPAARQRAPEPDEEGSDSEPEAVKEEMRALAGKLDRLERDMESLQFEPPPRQPQPPQPPAAKAAPPAKPSPPAGGSKPSHTPSIGSAAALQALERELELLEEKKRAVERLAHQLEPASDPEAGGDGDGEEGQEDEDDDDEEDDGFPLR